MNGMSTTDIGERIQTLRKAGGLSQEELAGRTGVSRQAVSKWESGQSMPELDKLLSISELFGVSADYLLKGTEPEKKGMDSRLGSRVLYVASTAFIFIGLFCGFAAWYENQTPAEIFGAMCVQALGLAGYFIGRALSGQRPAFAIKWLNLLGLTFMPCSILAGVFFLGALTPYPVDIRQMAVFAALYLAVAAGGFWLLRRRRG